jgi:hypothetical protein
MDIFLTKLVSIKIVLNDFPKLEVKKGEKYITKYYAHLKNMKLNG